MNVQTVGYQATVITDQRATKYKIQAVKMASLEYLESLEGGIDLENLGLPISNAENKQLEAQIQQKEKRITFLQRKANEHKDRIQAVTDHLKNVRQELHQTQVCNSVTT